MPASKCRRRRRARPRSKGQGSVALVSTRLRGQGYGIATGIRAQPDTSPKPPRTRACTRAVSVSALQCVPIMCPDRIFDAISPHRHCARRSAPGTATPGSVLNGSLRNFPQSYGSAKPVGAALRSSPHLEGAARELPLGAADSAALFYSECGCARISLTNRESFSTRFRLGKRLR